MQEVCPAEILSNGRALGPKLRALLLAQPLNELQPLKFSELPSRKPQSPVQKMNRTEEKAA